jgi:hypothetical protein
MDSLLKTERELPQKRGDRAVEHNTFQLNGAGREQLPGSAAFNY